MRLIKDKIKSPKRLKDITSQLKKKGKKIAFTNGCFDILHYGHISLLERAKKIADILIVAINSNSSVRRIKGKNRPILDLKDRMRAVAGLESVDFVTSFNQDTPLALIKLLKPDFIIKGGDWSRNRVVGKEIVESYGGGVVILPIIKGKSSSKIIEKIDKSSP